MSLLRPPSYSLPPQSHDHELDLVLIMDLSILEDPLTGINPLHEIISTKASLVLGDLNVDIETIYPVFLSPLPMVITTRDSPMEGIEITSIRILFLI